MASISITETVLRDGNQSFMATRMPLKSFESILSTCLLYTSRIIDKRFQITESTKKFLFAHFMHCNRYGDFYQ